MSRTLRIMAFIMGASWFFPVSCTTGEFFTIGLLTEIPHRVDIEKGELPLSRFYVVWQPGEASKPFGYASLDEVLFSMQPHPDRSFLMGQPSGQIDDGEFSGISYKLISSGASEQLIEVEWHNDDYRYWSRYRATRSKVTPESYRLMAPRQMFQAFPIAMAFAAAIYAIGRRLRKRVARTKAAENST